MNSFKKVDAVIYGHTHEGFSGTQAGIFFFNPGSPTTLDLQTAGQQV